GRGAGAGRGAGGRGGARGGVLSIEGGGVVANDNTARSATRFYQLLKPVYPGERGGRVVVELRLDGSTAIRFRGKYLRYREVPPGDSPGGGGQSPPASGASAADAREEKKPAPGKGGERTDRQPAGGRSGRTAAGPCPGDGEAKESGEGRRRPAEDHPWR